MKKPGVFLVLMFAAIGVAASEPQPAITLLAIDDVSLQFQRDVCYYLSRPQVRTEPVLTPSTDNPLAPDSVAAHFYGTVLQDGDRFRMWYYALSRGEKPDDFRQGPVCYAESADGLTWNKPNLGQVEFRGSRENNAVALPDAVTQFAGVIKDEQDPEPARRYKMVYTAFSDAGKTWLFRTATSEDGIRWQASPEFAQHAFLEMGSFYKHQGLFVAHGQSMGRSEGGHEEGRQGYACATTDFDRWPEAFANTLALPEPRDASLRGLTGDYEQIHLGVGAATFGNVCVGLYGQWHNPAPEQRNKNGWYGSGLIHCDFGLVVSNDGIHFREPVPGQVFLSSKDSAATPAAGAGAPTILCQANGILNVGNETRIYHGRWRNPSRDEDYYAEVALATLPRDRWGALGLVPKVEAGVVYSAPIRVPAGCGLNLNADRADLIRVEILDADSTLLPLYAGDNAGRSDTESGLDCAIAWPSAKLDALAGKDVIFAFHLARQADAEPRLFAAYLKTLTG